MRHAAAAVRVCGGAGAALLRVRCCACAAAPGAGPHHAALDAPAAVLPVVGRARMAGARGKRRAVGMGRSRPAAARLARRDADGSELAALPAAVEWPSLKKL